MKPIINKENVVPLFESKFIKVFDLQYEEGKHYFDATRRNIDDLVAIKTDDEFKKMLPDAVTCAVILIAPEGKSKLLLSREYRYPTGQFLLSPPAGLIDPEDRASVENGAPVDEALINTAKREIKEETSLSITDEDKVYVINKLLFSTPGMTDESNALVCAVINTDGEINLSSEGAVGSELFDGFVLVDEEEARKIIEAGTDSYGNYFSVYTWSVLMYFLSGLWR